MTAIWLLSTRGRPAEAQATIDACQQAGMTSPGVVYVDETVGLYNHLKLPRNWTVHYEPEWRSLRGSMQWCYQTYPDATAYGWLADDVRPRTKGWDIALEAKAGDYGLSYARDLWFSESETEERGLENGFNMSSGLCFGGELVRTAGWWAPPGMVQAGIDMTWLDIVRPFNLHRYVREVIVEHLNWRTGKRERDQGDEWIREGVNYVERDLVARRAYIGSRDYRQLLRALTAALGVDDPMPALRQSYLDSMWMRHGVPASRATLIMSGVLDHTLADRDR